MIFNRRSNAGEYIDCRMADTMIQPFLAKELSDREAEQYLSHVENCPRCKDELETYYMIDRTVHYLDENETQSFNLRPMFEQDLIDMKKEFRQKRHIHYYRLFVLWITILLVLLVLLDVSGIFKITEVLQFIPEQ